jgi:outer membrane lipoprotein
MRPTITLVALVLVAACARPPRPLQGEFPPVTVRDAQAGDRTGERVRWGGTIVSTMPERDRTCLEIVSKPLDRRAHPRDVDDSYGRFDACGQGFYDPQIYERGRDVTVVGTIDGSRSGRVGEYDYLFPRVAAEVILLWPEPPPYGRGYYDPYPTGVYVGPLWYPYWYPYWWGGYYGGWGGWGWDGGWRGGRGWHGGGRGGGGDGGRGGGGGGGRGGGGRR